MSPRVRLHVIQRSKFYGALKGHGALQGPPNAAAVPSAVSFTLTANGSAQGSDPATVLKFKGLQQLLNGGLALIAKKGNILIFSNGLNFLVVDGLLGADTVTAATQIVSMAAPAGATPWPTSTSDLATYVDWLSASLVNWGAQPYDPAGGPLVVPNTVPLATASKGRVALVVGSSVAVASLAGLLIWKLQKGGRR